MAETQPGQDKDVLASKLAEARSRLGQLALPAAELDRLHRQFIALCDAMKAPEADQVTGLRRLAAFLSTLDEAAAKSHGDKR